VAFGVELAKTVAAQALLIAYDIPTAHYIDYGSIFHGNMGRPTYVNSIAVGKDGTVYTLARIKEAGATRTDLISLDPVPGAMAW